MIIDMLAGGALVAVGIVLDRVLPRLAPGKRQVGDAICHSCDHGRGYHQDGTGPCKQSTDWSGKCKCQAYDGPVPYVEYYATELPK